MPIYEYTCKSCKSNFETLVKSMGSKADVKCPKCGSVQTSRNLSVFAVASAESRPSSSGGEPGMCGRCGGPGPCGMN